MSQGNSNAPVVSVFLPTMCAMATKTVPLGWMKLFVQIEVKIMEMHKKNTQSLFMTNFVSPFCSAVTCAPDQFACKDGTCIATAKLCDGTSDCPGGDDENKTLCYTVLVTPPQPHFTTAVPTSGKEFIFIFCTGLSYLTVLCFFPPSM